MNQPYLGKIGGQIDLKSGIVSLTAQLKQLGLRATSTFRRFAMRSYQGEATSGQTVEALPEQATTFGADEAEIEVQRALNKRC